MLKSACSCSVFILQGSYKLKDHVAQAYGPLINMLQGTRIYKDHVAQANSALFDMLQGSRIYKDHIAQVNDPVVDVLEEHGAIVLGTTNTPEFGAGANTFNELAC